MKKPQPKDFDINGINIEEIKSCVAYFDKNIPIYTLKFFVSIVFLIFMLIWFFNVEWFVGDKMSKPPLILYIPVSLAASILIGSIPLGILDAQFKIFVRLRGKLYPKYANIIKYEEELRAYYKYLERKKRFYWFSLSGWEFEKEFAILLKNIGLEVNVTAGSHDEGIDLIIKTPKRVVIQCKAHKKPVGPAVAREIYGSMNAFGADEGWLVNLGGFSKGVYSFAEGKSIRLIDIDEVLSLNEGIYSGSIARLTMAS